LDDQIRHSPQKLKNQLNQLIQMKNQAEETRILLTENSAAIQTLESCVPVIAEKLNNILSIYSDLKIDAPIENIKLIFSLTGVEAFVKEQLIKGFTEEQLHFAGSKVNPAKAVELIELPDYRELEKAVDELHEYMKLNGDASLTKPYAIKGDKVVILQDVLDAEIEKHRIYIKSEQGLRAIKSMEEICKQLNETIIPISREKYVYGNPLSLPNYPTYSVNTEKLVRDMFVWDRENRTFSPNPEFILKLQIQ
jgi:hypothetical protein